MVTPGFVIPSDASSVEYIQGEGYARCHALIMTQLRDNSGDFLFFPLLLTNTIKIPKTIIN